MANEISRFRIFIVLKRKNRNDVLLKGRQGLKYRVSLRAFPVMVLHAHTFLNTAVMLRDFRRICEVMNHGIKVSDNRNHCVGVH